MAVSPLQLALVYPRAEKRIAAAVGDSGEGRNAA